MTYTSCCLFEVIAASGKAKLMGYADSYLQN